MTPRGRLSASVDADLLEAGRSAVAEGRADTVSGWVNGALRRQVDHDRRMQGLDEFLDAYEAEHGVISPEEIREATRVTRARAVLVRPTEEGDPDRSRQRSGAG